MEDIKNEKDSIYKPVIGGLISYFVISSLVPKRYSFFKAKKDTFFSGFLEGVSNISELSGAMTGIFTASYLSNKKKIQENKLF